MRAYGDLSDAEIYPLPRPPLPGITPTGFMMCPVSFQCGPNSQQWQCLQSLYQYAFEQAQAVARPSLPERDLIAVWN
jgi:hypothetical protein